MVGSLLGSLLGTKYTIGELMQIDQGRQKRAGKCRVKLIKTIHRVKKEGLLDRFKSLFGGKNSVLIYNVIFKFEVTSDTGNHHTVYIKTSPDFSYADWKNNKVKLSCDCQDFKFRSAYQLNSRSSLYLTSSIRVNLGAALTDKPSGKAGSTLLCKHAFAAISWLKENYEKVMKTV